MKEPTSGVLFSVPYEIAVVRPLRQTTLKEREEALKAAYYNTELLPQELIYVDLKTDGGVSSMSTTQLSKLIGAGALESGMEMAPEGSRAFVSLSENFHTIFGFPYVVPVAQGRAAERIWAKMHVKEGAVVPGNMLFPSTRFHIESNGGKVIDVISDDAHNLSSGQLFKGNIDLTKLENAFKERGEKVSCVCVELCVNSCGGHPISLENLKAVKSITDAHKVPLFLDACRILENSYLIKQREPGYQDRSIQEIVHETCSCADGLTMSAALQEIFVNDSYLRSRVEQVNYLWRRLKDGVSLVAPAGGHGVFINVKGFLPHVPAENLPGEALAAFIYHISGIRVTKGPPLAASQTARGVELLRLAVPARRYLQ